MAAPRIGRRELAVLGPAAGAALFAGDARRRPPAHVPLFSATVAMTGDGQRSLIAPGSAPLPAHSRILPPTSDDAPALVSERELVAAARMVGASLDADRQELLTSAVLDLHVLSYGLPAPIAGWSHNWRYVWPRDAAHVAVAFARLGLVERAAGIVRALARLCGADGWLQARYRPGSQDQPDDRERQLDGTGWYLWALEEVSQVVPGLAGERAVADAASRSARLLLTLTQGRDHMPPPSPDYWEVRESHLTIATAALVLVGLERAADLALPESGRAAERAEALRAGIIREFGPSGYGRYAGRAPADAGLLFLLPPYTRTAVGAAAARVGTAQQHMRREAGGVAPGEGWKRDGISWTPETALFAQAHRELGNDAAADVLLDWLAAHRTDAGSLPEKVLADGAPAAVAPLAWTAALTVTSLVPRRRR